MFWHPLFLAILSAQIVSLILILAACPAFMRTALYWRAHVADSRQLSLETKVEGASIQVRAAFWLYLFSIFLLIFGIANIFHEDIPGAMCGTGVCQAMSEKNGIKLLLYSGFLLLIMQLWYDLDKLNRMHAESPLTVISARIFLAIPAVALLAFKQTYDAFSGILSHQPVDCCAIIYDQFSTLKSAKSILGIGDTVWIGTFVVLTLLLFGLSVTISGSRVDRPRIKLALAVTSWVWMPVAALTLVDIFSAYHYQVLHHHCPWCLFLPEHRLVGYPLYGAIYFVGMEGATLFILPWCVKQNVDVMRMAKARGRRAARCILIAQIVFLFMAIVPAIVWRLNHGVWLTG